MGYRKVSISEAAKGVKEAWTQLKIGSVEDYDIKVAVYGGAYHRHMHVKHDEFIFVLSGEIKIDFDDGEIALGPGDGVIIQKGTPHQSSCKGRAEVLLVEKDTIMGDYVNID